MTAGEPDPRDRCGVTVDRMHAFNVAGAPVDDLDLDCPTVFLTIDEGKDRENSELMANAMYKCATQFRRGTGELFTEDGVYCNVCYVFDVPKPVKGFYSYLIKNKVPGGSGETYHEYMQGYRSAGAEKVLDELQQPLETHYFDDEKQSDEEIKEILEDPRKSIETVELPTGQYAVIFIYTRGQEHLLKVWRHVTGQTREGRVGLALGGISFLTITGTAGGAAFMVYMIPSIAAGPVGIAILGTGAVLGAGAFVFSEILTHHFSQDTPPEHVSFFVFRQWDTDTDPDNPESARSLLADNIGCEYIA